MPKNATTTLPLVAQVDEAQPFMACDCSGSPVQATCSHSSLPSRRSMAKTTRCRPLSSAVVRKIWLPHTTGVDWPEPLSRRRQSTSSSDQLSGKPVSSVWLVPSGPPQRGQFSSA